MTAKIDHDKIKEKGSFIIIDGRETVGYIIVQGCLKGIKLNDTDKCKLHSKKYGCSRCKYFGVVMKEIEE